MSVEDIIDKFTGSGSHRLQFHIAVVQKLQVTLQCMTTDKSHIQTIMLYNSNALFCNLYYMYILFKKHSFVNCELTPLTSFAVTTIINDDYDLTRCSFG